MTGLEAVFLAHREQLLRFFASHGAADAAEDLLHELWLKVGSADAGPIATPLPYLYRAANNLVLDRYRAERQARLRDRAWSAAVGTTIPGQSDEPSSERRLIARERLARAEAALAQAGARAAAIFRRHRLDGLAQKDVAQEMGVSLSTVESDLRRAARALVEARRHDDEV